MSQNDVFVYQETAADTVARRTSSVLPNTASAATAKSSKSVLKSVRALLFPTTAAAAADDFEHQQ